MAAIHQISYAHLFKNTDHSDIQFIVKNRAGDSVRIPAHRLVLVVQSPVYESLYGDLSKPSISVHIGDAFAEDYEEFLRLFYMPGTQVSAECAAGVLKLADIYQVGKIVATCEDFMLRTLNEITAYEYYRLCLVYGLTTVLRKKSEDILCRNPIEVFNKSNASKNHSLVLASIIKLDKFMCDEVDVFNGLMAWAKGKVAVYKQTSENDDIRKAVSDMIKDIRFPTMDFSDLIKCLQEHPGLLPPEQCMDLLNYAATKELRPSINAFSTINRLRSKYVIPFIPDNTQGEFWCSISNFHIYWKSAYEASFQITLMTDHPQIDAANVHFRHEFAEDKIESVEFVQSADYPKKRVAKVNTIITFYGPGDRYSLEVRLDCRRLVCTRAAIVPTNLKLPNGFRIDASDVYFVSGLVLTTVLKK